MVDAGCIRQCAIAHGVLDDALDLRFGIAERVERGRYRTVDDLEVTAACQLLELDQREVRLDAGGVAIHHQADCAGRRDNGGLGIAVAVLGAKLDRPVPGCNCMVKQLLVRAVGMIKRHRVDGQLLIALGDPRAAS